MEFIRWARTAMLQLGAAVHWAVFGSMLTKGTSAGASLALVFCIAVLFSVTAVLSPRSRE